jgi:hypothetical protein
MMGEEVRIMTALRFALLAVLVGGGGCWGYPTYIGVPGEVPEGEDPEPCEGPVGSILAEGEDVPAGIAVDESFVYWVTYTWPGTIRRMSKDGCIPPETIAAVGYAPRSILVDNTNVYWGDQGSAPVVRAVPKAGGAITVIGEGHAIIDFLAQDATNIYWPDPWSHQILTAPKTGGATTLVVSGTGNIAGLAVDDTHVYWSDYDDGAVKRAAKDGGGAIQGLASAGPGTWSVAVDSSMVYWVAGGTEELWSVDKTGGTPSLLASGWNFRGLATWGGRVFWAQNGYSTAGSAAVGASDASGTDVFSTSDPGPWWVAVDDTGVYYTDMYQGSIIRL